MLLDDLRFVQETDEGGTLKSSILISGLLVLLGVSAFAQDDKPLGEVAREARASKSSSPKAAKVVTNDEVPSSETGPGGGTLSPDKQAFCDELRRRKDPGADQSCSVMRVDMGSEYETLTARTLELGEQLCGASGGTGLPTSLPTDPTLAARAREWGASYARFMELMKAHMQSSSEADGKLNAVRQKEFQEFAVDVPDLRNTSALLANPLEKQRFIEIEKKYKGSLEEAEKIVQQIRVRGLRFLVDEARLSTVCEFRTQSMKAENMAGKPRR